MKKSSIILAFFLLFSSAAFSYTGIMAERHGNLRIAKTKYFDIIYTPDSEASADIVFQKADSIYEELLTKYTVPHVFRTTVTISPANEHMNAYFTCFPYNSIVLYDSPQTEDMMVYSETLINTFRHELIHAVTYNSKNTFWYVIGKIFGDTISPSVASTTIGFAEGATVSTESEFGEGRMNSEWHTFVIRQAKVEGKFPKYSEVQGARDVFPGVNTSYYFGGAFSAYLQKKYGMEKYAQFWYNATNIQKLSYLFYFSNFKSVYGLSFFDAWENFYDSIKVPDVPAHPWEEDWCTRAENYSNYKNRSGDGKMTRVNRGTNLYSCLATCDAGFAWFDNTRSEVYFAELNTKGANLKPRRVRKINHVTNIALSADGKYMAISYNIARPNKIEKNRIVVLDLKKNKVLRIRGSSQTSEKNGMQSSSRADPNNGAHHGATSSSHNNTKRGLNQGLRDGTIFMSDGKYYLAAVKAFSQDTSLHFFEITDRGFSPVAATKNASPNALVETGIFTEHGYTIYSPAGTSDGKVFFMNKEKLDFKLYAYDFKKNELYAFSSPEFYKDGKHIEIRSLKAAPGNRLTFAYTQKESFPRMGIITYSPDLKNMSLSLQDEDNSGGVFFPVIIPERTAASPESSLPAKVAENSPSTKVAFIGSFFEDKKILIADCSKLKMREGSLSAEVVEPTSGTDTDTTTTSAELSKIPEPSKIGEESKKYSSLEYTFKGPSGVFIPLSIAKSMKIERTSMNKFALASQYLLPFGLTYVSASPWTDPIWYVQAGYMPFYNTFSVSAISHGTTNLFTFNLSGEAAFDEQGFKQTFGSASLSMPISLPNHWSITLSDTSEIFFGRQNKAVTINDKWNDDVFSLDQLLGFTKETDGKNRFFTSNSASLSLENLTRTGPGYGEIKGFTFTPFWYNRILKTWDGEEYLDDESASYSNIGLDLAISIPRLLPFESYNNTVCLPLVLQAILFPKTGENALFGGKLTLFSTEIQKSTNSLPLLYFNRFTISSIYKGGFSERNLTGTDSNFTDGTAQTGTQTGAATSQTASTASYTSSGLPSYAIFQSGKYISNIFNGDCEYNDELSLHLNFELTPNVGGLSRSFFKVSLDAGIHYRFFPEKNQSNFAFSLLGITVF